MENTNIIFQNCTVEELAEKIASILQAQQKAHNPQTESDFITRDEVCTLLNINKTTLNKHTRANRLKSYGIGNRVLYKLSEVMEAVKPLKK